MDEIPDFVIALLLIALDESTTPDNQQDIIQLVDSICNLAEAEWSKVCLSICVTNIV